jgi:hypothetical protein
MPTFASRLAPITYPSYSWTGCVCDAAGRCSRPYELRFGHIPVKADENNAIALSA